MAKPLMGAGPSAAVPPAAGGAGTPVAGAAPPRLPGAGSLRRSPPAEFRGASPPASPAGERRGPGETRGTQRRWSRQVTRESNALDLEPGVFRLASPRAVALSLRRSALASARRKTDPFRSAMSMLNFYLNRAGKNLPAERRRVLQAAKDELRRTFGHESRPRAA